MFRVEKEGRKGEKIHLRIVWTGALLSFPMFDEPFALSFILNRTSAPMSSPAGRRNPHDNRDKKQQKIKEAEKKQLRKAKQLFRKLTMAAYQSMNPNDSSETGNDAVWDDLEKMNDDVSKSE